MVTLDSMGDDLNQTVWIPKEFGGLKRVASSSECELARVYKFVTLILSMKPDEHEYKVMGWSYAKESYCLDIYNQVFKNLVQVKGCKIIHNKRPKDLYGYLKNSLKNIDLIILQAQLKFLLRKNQQNFLIKFIKNIKSEILL